MVTYCNYYQHSRYRVILYLCLYLLCEKESSFAVLGEKWGGVGELGSGFCYPTRER